MWWIVLALLLVPSWAGAQECRADVNRNGVTDISDLITAVNESLEGCGAEPTPTRPPLACPLTFCLQTAHLDLCEYEGPFNGRCGETLRATWTSSGPTSNRMVTVHFQTNPPISMRADAVPFISCDEATAFEWTDDGFGTAHSFSAKIRLDGGRLRVRLELPGETPLKISDCDFTVHEGDFVRRVPNP